MKRLDVLITTRSFAPSREKARRMIEAGAVFVNGRVITRPSEKVAEEADIQVLEGAIKYVSRGGIKLEAALDSFMTEVQGLICADIGASTGGFTDCLLQRGAFKVYAIDNGSGQLDPVIRQDSRVVVLENLNARHLHVTQLDDLCDLVVMDVSFISQKLLYKNVAAVLKSGGAFISLVKPQFEAGRESLSKGGIVREARQHIRVLDELVEEAAQVGLYARGLIYSPITGGDGNIEYLMNYTHADSERLVTKPRIETVVSEAFNYFKNKD